MSSARIKVSIVILTYKRDAVLAEVVARLHEKAGDRSDYEVILIDNNPEKSGRDELLRAFPHRAYHHDGRNKGVSARNIGMESAAGDYIIVLDDDVFVETDDFIGIFERLFEAEPDVGAITIRKHVRGEEGKRVDLIPHTRKDVDLASSFLTFRFVGGCVGFRASAIRQVGAFLPDFFYGCEEIELAYRIVDGGWRIRYSPEVVVEELEHPAGRKPERESQTDRLYNKYIMSWLHMPFPQILLNYMIFTPYIAYRAKGRISIAKAVMRFGRWLMQKDRPRRKPLSLAARAYIRQCDGAVWR